MTISSEVKKEIIVDFGKNPKNTGCIDVQVALITKRIQELTIHVKNNTKDFASKRSLYALVSKQHHLLKYLKNKDIESYYSLIKKLNLNK